MSKTLSLLENLKLHSKKLPTGGFFALRAGKKHLGWRSAGSSTDAVASADAVSSVGLALKIEALGEAMDEALVVGIYGFLILESVGSWCGEYGFGDVAKVLEFVPPFWVFFFVL